MLLNIEGLPVNTWPGIARQQIGGLGANDGYECVWVVGGPDLHIFAASMNHDSTWGS